MSEKKNLVDCLTSLEGSNRGIYFVRSKDNDVYVSYPELLVSARKLLKNLEHTGVSKGDEVVFQFDDNLHFVRAFWACLLGGMIPVPISLAATKELKMKLHNVWGQLNNPWLVTDKIDTTASTVSQVEQAISTRTIVMSSVLEIDRGLADIRQPRGQDIAFIQFSSGSTGDPKGVILTHDNLMANVKGIGLGSQMTAADSMLSWLPLTHDMGLISFHLTPLYHEVTQVHIPTNLFVRRPTVWPDKLTQHRSTMTSSPNFGYRFLLKQMDMDTPYNWDLSSVRVLFNGAEPISVDVCHDFMDVMARYQLRRTALLPSYGLAEACVGVAFARLGDELAWVNIDRMKTNPGTVIQKEPQGDNTVAFVNIGTSIPYCTLRIATDDNRDAGEAVIGHIQIKGENVTQGYYNNERATRAVMREGGWLDTGDLGFIDGGCLFVTGRAKDIIFVNGQNFYPHDLERLVETIDGLELGKVVCAGYTSQETGTEEVVMFVTFRGKLEGFIPIIGQCKKIIRENTGIDIGTVVPVDRIPKTTSGKVQRFKLLSEYLRGDFAQEIADIHQLMKASSPTSVVQPRNEMEQQLHSIWVEVFGRNDFGVEDNFFDLGGDSIKATQIASKIAEMNYEVDKSIIFEKVTIDTLAAYLGTCQQRVDNAGGGSTATKFDLDQFSSDELDRIFN